MDITIIGLGLIGGSLGLALKSRGWEGKIKGFDENPSHMDEALSLELVDEICQSLDDALEGSDIAVVAVPVKAIPDIVVHIADNFKNIIITDVGSVKKYVLDEISKKIGNRYIKFIPGHPIAGTEKSGPSAALSDLFVDRRVVLCDNRFEEIRRMWEFVGAKVEYLDPETHDKIFGAVSHLPHLVAYALVDAISMMEEEEDAFFRFVASGFRDFTRIASSDPVMWRDIFLTNKKSILQSLIFFRNAIDKLEAQIIMEDEENLEKQLAKAKETRDRAISRMK